MSNSTIRGLASIIVPCWNQVAYTQQCLAALRKHSRLPWELIVVDNGSTDETGTYLAGVRDIAAVPVTVISNSKNLGFPAAINQGLRAARGEYLVLLNNDVVVTDGWLDQLIALANAKGDRVAAEGGCGCAGASPPGHSADLARGCSGAAPPDPPSGRGGTHVGGSIGIGLVGPMSNYAAPPQLVEGATYRDLGEMPGFARRWRDEHRGEWFTLPKLSGFCLLMKRAVYDKIGGLDERFGLGFFDDDDLAERARRAGFELAVAHDLFVHHFGSRTFAGNGIDAGKLLDENAGRFAAKWGRNGPNGKRVALRPFVESGSPSSQSQFQTPQSRRIQESPDRALETPPVSHAERARVSLTMIVKDEENNLPHCLESVSGVFDEIVIVDTGSTDRTIEIARSFGAQVFEFEWIDSFAAARNEALSHATGDYAFWLDADDVVEPRELEKLQAILASLRAGGQAAFVVRCACDPSPDGTGGETVVDHIRLFPLRDDVRWTYRVHEQILPALRRANVPVRWTDLTIRHTGYVDAALRARKLERDIRILKHELEDRPDDPFVLFNLGAIAIERREWEQALGFLNRSLAGSAPTDSIVRKLFALIARAHQMLGDSRAALATCARGLELDPEDGELWFRKAVVHRHRGECHEAEQSWRRILGLRRPDQFCSVDQGIYGHLTRRNLAALAAERGDRAEAERLWNEVLAECPGDREALAKLLRPQAVTQVARETGTGAEKGPWIIPGSRRTIVPATGLDDFDPYAPVAERWIRALDARLVVELGVRFDVVTRALLAGARAVDGRIWGIDELERHEVTDERFTFIQADPMKCAARWEPIDLLHVDIEPQRQDDGRRWLKEYANRCRAIAVHHSHHPGFRLGPVIAEQAATDQWQVFEYSGNLAGWTVLARRGEACPEDDQAEPFSGPTSTGTPEAA